MKTVRRSIAAGLSVALMITMLATQAYAQDEVELVPLEDTTFGIRSVVPAGWTAIAPGIHDRAGSPGDSARLGLQAVPGTVAALWPSLMPQFGLESVPGPVGERTTDAFDWTLYRFDAPPSVGEVTFDIAFAEDDGTTYLVLLQASPDARETLHASVFLPALDAFELLAPPTTTAPAPEGYGSEEVSFPGGAAGVTLAGTLTVPDSPGPHPVVVLFSGSGASNRDEAIPEITALAPFAVIADALSRAGIAVLRYDDRGVGASTGDFDSAAIADLTADAEAAVDFAASVADIDPERIGLLGHSEGGLFAASIGAHDPRVAFVVGMAAPALRGLDILVEQNVVQARGAGYDEAEAERLRAGATKLYAAILEGDFEGAEALNRGLLGEAWDTQTPEVQATLGDRDAYVDSAVEAAMPVLTGDWYGSFLASDPVADWEQITIPVLALFGGKDTQVLTVDHEPALRDAFTRAGNESAEIVVLPDANHLFQAADTGLFSEYGTLAPEFTSDFLPTLVEWVAEQASVAR
jgi:pimeloyl-ACP methyl ester carboxylesterase